MLNGCINKVSRCEIGMMAQISFKRLVATRIDANQPARFLNVKILVGAFNQEKTLVGAFSLIVKS